MWLSLLIMLTLLLIIYEDFRYRAVKVIYYVLLLGALAFQQWYEVGPEMLVIQAFLNVLYIALLLIFAALYFYIKNRRFELFQYIGPGDLLFLGALACWFDPVGFVWFNTASLIVSLLLHMLFKRLKQYPHPDTVPLAGMQALCFVPVFISASLVGIM
jgi:hypothetical protein